ncbi:MAG: 4Fe-4S binding protein [Campylobacteraceae bacterium]
MKKPKLTSFTYPKTIFDFPDFICFEAGHLVSTNKSYRVKKPVVDESTCTNCLLCYIACPDGAIFRLEKLVNIDYDFCKGCGICAIECKSGVIKMIEEE